MNEQLPLYLAIFSTLIATASTVIAIIVALRVDQMENELRRLRPPRIMRDQNGRRINERL